MKKMLALAILLISTGVVSAQMPPLPMPLYPLKVGSRWTYIVSDPNGLAAKDEVRRTTIQVEREEPYVVMKKGADGKDTEVKYTGFILKMTSGANEKRDHVVVMEDGFYTVHVAGTLMSPPVCNIKLPSAGKGWQPWEADSKSGNTTVKGTFSVRSANVKVPAGTYDKAFQISFTNNINGDDRVEVDCWYALNVGMVKQRILQKRQEIVLELKEFELAK